MGIISQATEIEAKTEKLINAVITMFREGQRYLKFKSSGLWSTYPLHYSMLSGMDSEVSWHLFFLLKLMKYDYALFTRYSHLRIWAALFLLKSYPCTSWHKTLNLHLGFYFMCEKVKSRALTYPFLHCTFSVEAINSSGRDLLHILSALSLPWMPPVCSAFSQKCWFWLRYL